MKFLLLALTGFALTITGCAQLAPTQSTKQANSTVVPSPLATAPPKPTTSSQVTTVSTASPSASAALPIATPVQGPATILPTPTNSATTSAVPAPSSSPPPLTIPKASGPLPEMRLDAGKSIPVIVPKDVSIQKLRAGSEFYVVVADDGIPFRSGVDDNLEPGTKIFARVEKVQNGQAQFVFTHVIDGAGKRYPMIAGMATQSGGRLPAWQRDADDKRRQDAQLRTRKLQEAYDRDRADAFDKISELRARDAEWGGDVKSMAVVLPWAMGSKGPLIALASYAAGKYTNKVRQKREAERATSLKAWQESRQDALEENESATREQLAGEYTLDAFRAARTTLRADLARGDQVAVTLTFPFSTTETPDEIAEKLIP